MRVLLFFTLLHGSAFAFACKMDPKTAERADKVAIKDYLKKHDYKSYEIKEIVARGKYYEAKIREGRAGKNLKLKVERAPDCRTTVKLIK